MTHLVFELAPTALTTAQHTLAPYAVAHQNAHALTVAKLKGCTLTLYASGKLLIQGSQAQAVAADLGFMEMAEQASSKNTAISNSTRPTATGQPSNQLSLIGSDEVGNGSYFGGLAVVASYVTPSDHTWLRQLGVGDSKTLTDQKIRQIAPLLEEKIPHKALLLTPKKYNQVVGEGLRHNAVSVKVALHNQAIFLLLQEVSEPEAIVIDAFTSESNYRKYLRQEVNQFHQPISLIQKAESQYLAVAASSIIARKLFLDNLDSLSQQIGLTLPSGAGTASDKVASQILARFGQDGLTQVAKWHFKNTQKAYNLLKKR
ncbi:ribonuclease HIII [Streptococcus entericus]|uniref:ribonuclease HIII n=1 Tax=Streptococcus entericus TaxID=155680 RepID=UPI0003762C57|nr:ribonuclease HIII [Streptococcus entericus]